MQNVKCLNVMGGGWGGMDGSVVQARPPRHSEWGGGQKGEYLAGAGQGYLDI